jgi:hypothetical protein
MSEHFAPWRLWTLARNHSEQFPCRADAFVRLLQSPIVSLPTTPPLTLVK